MRPSRAKKSENLEAYGQVLFPDEAQEPVLAPATRAALMQWLEELWAEDELAAVDLKPRKKCMLSGVPGCGKTTLAHHLAARFGLPLAVVQSEKIIDSYIGSTGQNIGGLFDAAAQTDCVLFLDEFDSLGMARTKATQGAETERNHSVNTLLQKLEAFDGILIAATNRPDDLDSAVWRRFQLQITIDLPQQTERERILAMYLAPYELNDNTLRQMGRDTQGATPALLRELCEALKRNLVLGPRLDWDMAVAAVFDRILEAIAPHPELARPPLWSSRGKSETCKQIEWPLTTREGGTC